MHACVEYAYNRLCTCNKDTFVIEICILICTVCTSVLTYVYTVYSVHTVYSDALHVFYMKYCILNQ